MHGSTSMLAPCRNRPSLQQDLMALSTLTRSGFQCIKFHSVEAEFRAKETRSLFGIFPVNVHSFLNIIFVAFFIKQNGQVFLQSKKPYLVCLVTIARLIS
jgi:hypothetical protein